MQRSVVIVDDHAGFRACARRLLENEGYQVVGEAADGNSGFSQAKELGPEMMLVDVSLPDIDGFELCARLAALDHAPAVLLTSSRDCAELEPLAPCGCVCGVVPKDQLSGEALDDLWARACASS